MFPCAVLLAELLRFGGDAGALQQTVNARLDLSARAERSGKLTFVRASMRLVNEGSDAILVRKGRRARIWAQGMYSWVFEIMHEDGKTVPWLCGIRDAFSTLKEEQSIRPDQSVTVDLPFPCAQLDRPGRYRVVAKFQDVDARSEVTNRYVGPVSSAEQILEVSP
jgi:hypothetical protein